MDYDLNAEVTALEMLVVIAANELIESYESVDSGVMPKNQHRLAQAVYALRRFRKRSVRDGGDRAYCAACRECPECGGVGKVSIHGKWVSCDNCERGEKG